MGPVHFYGIVERYFEAIQRPGGPDDFAMDTVSRGLTPRKVTFQYFMAQFSWVVLSMGLNSVSAIRVHNDILVAFDFFRDANYDDLIRDLPDYLYKGVVAFYNYEKVSMVSDAITFIHECGGFVRFRDTCLVPDDVLDRLTELRGIGKQNRKHLARNIGVDVIYEDRNLLRIARQFGFSSPESLCNHIAKEKVTPWTRRVSVISYLLWLTCSVFGDVSIDYMVEKMRAVRLSGGKPSVMDIMAGPDDGGKFEAPE